MKGFLVLFYTFALCLSMAFGAAVPAKTIAQGSDLVTGKVEVTGVFYIVPRDINSNNVNEAGLNFTVDFGSNSFTHFLTYDSVSGKYQVEYRTLVSGNYSVSIKLDDINISGSPYSLIVSPGEVVFSKSTFTGDGWLQLSTAGVTSVFGIIFRDDNNNIIYYNPSDIEFTVEYSDIILNPPPLYSRVYPSDNQMTFEYRSNRTGGIDLTLKFTNQLTNFWTKQISVIAGPLEESQTDANLDVFLIPWPPAGTSGTIEVYPKDSFQNQLLPAFISSDVNQFQMKLSLLNQSGDVINSITYNSTTDKALADSTKYLINFSPITIAGNYSIEITRQGKHIKGSPNQFRVIPADIDGSKSELLKNFTQSERVGDIYTFQIVARDTYGNKRISGGQLSLFLVQIYSGALEVVSNITDNGNGEYTVKYSYPSSGRYLVEAFFFLDALLGSGQTVNAFSETSPSLSEARGQGLKRCKIATNCRFIVQVKDQYGNNQTGTSDNVTVLVGRSEPKYSVLPLGSGIYAIEYRGTSGSKLHVQVNGEEVKGSPFSTYMAPSDGAVGVIVAIFIFLAVAIALTAYIIYKRRQVAELRKEWEMKKVLAYKEYQVDQTAPPVPLNNSLGQANEPEWEDDEYPDGIQPTRQDGDDNEWSVMSKWVKPENK